MCISGYKSLWVSVDLTQFSCAKATYCSPSRFVTCTTTNTHHTSHAVSTVISDMAVSKALSLKLECCHYISGFNQ